jgi:hypothetical protein
MLSIAYRKQVWSQNKIWIYNMNIIFPLILFYYLNRLLFKFDFFSQKIARNKIS